MLRKTLNLFTVNAGNTSRETLPAVDDDFWESGRGGGGGVQQVGKSLTHFVLETIHCHHHCEHYSPIHDKYQTLSARVSVLPDRIKTIFRIPRKLNMRFKSASLYWGLV